MWWIILASLITLVLSVLISIGFTAYFINEQEARYNNLEKYCLNCGATLDRHYFTRKDVLHVLGNCPKCSMVVERNMRAIVMSKPKNESV